MFNKTPFMAGNAKKNTSRCGGVEWKVLLEDTRWFRNGRGAVRGRGLFGERSAFRTVRGRARVRGRNMVSWSSSCAQVDWEAEAECNLSDSPVSSSCPRGLLTL